MFKFWNRNFVVVLRVGLEVTSPKILSEKVLWHGVKIHIYAAINVLKLKG
jgi:hypothetical protein